MAKKKATTIREKMDYIQKFDNTVTDAMLLQLTMEKLEDFFVAIQNAEAAKEKAVAFIELSKMGLLK